MTINPKPKPHYKIPTINQCDSKGHEDHTVVSDFHGSLLVQRSAFPYFALLAFDLGGILRLILLLLAAPLSSFLHHFVSESLGIRVLIFATFVGARVSDIKSSASAVLPKHYSEDLHPETWRVFASCKKRIVLTAHPRIMVEPFLKTYLGVDVVLGTEISSYKGIATGLVAETGVLVGKKKAVALREAFGSEDRPDIGIGATKMDLPFMKLCKERYIVPSRTRVRPVRPDKLPKPVVFHDSRLVPKPTPLVALFIVLWFPIGIALSIVRVLAGALGPISMICNIMQFLGCPTTIKGTPPKIDRQSASQNSGVVFVCNHRCVLDSIYVSACLRRMTTVVSYSISALSESLSPVKTETLVRDRTKDSELIEKILSKGNDLVICPEGTTCREPFLLRFSSLFAELTDQIVPVAVRLKASMFHGSTARGHKWLDPFFFFMNPIPGYEVTFLEKLPLELTCSAGKSSHEVANHVQELIGKSLGYKCTDLTRKDKYRALTGTDGIVGQKPMRRASKLELH